MAFELGLGCILDVPTGQSCGDGWWDERYEACDPKDPASFLEHCRDQNIDVDGACDPLTCQLLPCQLCGDGVASGSEACDGDDIPHPPCTKATCLGNCTIDIHDCPAVCGDGLITGDEECELPPACTDDLDCPAGYSCRLDLELCAQDGPGGFTLPTPCFGHSATTASGITGKSTYTHGNLGQCNFDRCKFGRDTCSFCGDGVLDDDYTDISDPEGTVSIAAEVCDGELADPARLSDYCREWCAPEEGTPADLEVACDFKCNDDCSDFELPGTTIPGQDIKPSDIDCCLASETLCPPYPNIPELPCCAWLEAPEPGEEPKPQVCDLSSLFPGYTVCP